ncbi:hypothetical protein KP79_PYT03083 [Mizuhopecten yessoensis]|uniref:NAD-dependent epimerase/dehydratase domain-containing protein n=1 Tax=Mizuhopecten yessoensis TaxID=6573 RepID=A0A210PJC1_MIZYE|nr:hypothetical protein KP79_PYT03083 [Mizuhopecten yessoensis]
MQNCVLVAEHGNILIEWRRVLLDNDIDCQSDVPLAPFVSVWTRFILLLFSGLAGYTARARIPDTREKTFSPPLRLKKTITLEEDTMVFGMTRFTILLSIYLLLQCTTGSAKTIFVLGGNGLLGSAFMERVIEKRDNLVVVNRGNWYWDTSELILPFVTPIQCNRRNSLGKCPDLAFLLSGEGKDIVFDAVVDFSSFAGENVADILDVLNERIKRYIFISSDSTYEVCMKNHTKPTVESDSVRPVPETERIIYSKKDTYGHRKLEGEEVLEAQKDGGVPFVAMRLPDVIGPRDNIYRWWMYQLWIKLSDYLDRPVSVPAELTDRPLSFVYSYDVADMIVKLLDADLDVFNQAYNFAFEENPTLTELLKAMAVLLDRPDIQIDVNKNADMTYLWPSAPSQQQYDVPELSALDENWSSSIYMFPSVSLGAIDTSKAKLVLGWKPTLFQEAVRKSIMFFEEAMIVDKFEEERSEIKRALLLHFSKDHARTLAGLDIVYPKSRNVHQEL